MSVYPIIVIACIAFYGGYYYYTRRRNAQQAEKVNATDFKAEFVSQTNTFSQLYALININFIFIPQPTQHKTSRIKTGSRSSSRFRISNVPSCSKTAGIQNGYTHCA